MPRGIPKSGKRVMRKPKFGGPAGPGSKVPPADLSLPDEGMPGGMGGGASMKKGGKLKTKRKGAR